MLAMVCASGLAMAHSTIKGKITNAKTNEALTNVFVQLKENNKLALTDVNGAYEFKGLASGIYTVLFSTIGYKTEERSVSVAENETIFLPILLTESYVELSEIAISPRNEVGLNTISAIDFKLRTYNTTQDLLRSVPGLFIAQHAGGGKAEQIFLRGFDIDHGTDISINVDGMPVNMVSHAHGQGYADLHFVIPETIDNLSFSKGPYDAKTGDFNTAGAVRFQTKNTLKKSMVKLEAGRFDMARGVAMLNLLGNGNDTIPQAHNAYIAAEYYLTRGFFESPQNFNRLNIFGKYSGQVNTSTNVSASLSAFSSKWNQSGQIPERAVASGMITDKGSIDDSEGGSTSRYNANLIIIKTLADDAIIKNQIYYSNYNFNLYSNFTFFLEDSVNGDQINQYESRNIFGYNGSYSKNIMLGNLETRTVAGIGLRNDMINNIGLARTTKRSFVYDIRKGDVEETNANAYVEESFYLTKRLTVTGGARIDHFRFLYNSRMTDTLGKIVSKTIVSPKLNIYYTVAKNIQLYTSAGSGFHSNDARVASTRSSVPTLPRALSVDLGTNIKVKKKLFINTALWMMDLESEFVYVGDAGIIEPSGRSRRMGVDLSARYQIYKWLYADIDVNITKPRLRDEANGNNLIPLAPPISSIGGLSVKANNGINGSLRYRYLGDRPAIEDNSIVAKGYFIVDAVINYTKDRYSFGLSAENLLNRMWKEAQFATESRLKDEAVSVNEIHYTPGTPFFVKGSITYLF